MTATKRNVSSPETADLVLGLLREKPKRSVRELADATGKGGTTMLNALARLRLEGRIVVVRRGTGAGYPTTYEVTS